MSDFLEADIDELLEEKPEKKLSADEKAYLALQKDDERLIGGFTDERKRLNWPKPVTKRWRR